jgi:hypothetical protein
MDPFFGHFLEVDKGLKYGRKVKDLAFIVLSLFALFIIERKDLKMDERLRS